MDLERQALDQIMKSISEACDIYDVIPVEKIGDLTARLINRGKPAGYVVTSEGTFMVTVEMVSRAIMASE